MTFTNDVVVLLDMKSKKVILMTMVMSHDNSDENDDGDAGQSSQPLSS